MTGPGHRLEELPVGAAVVADGRLVTVNGAFARILRATPHQLSGVTMTSLLAPEDATSTLAAPASGDDGTGWRPVAGIAPDGAPWTGQLVMGPQAPRGRVVPSTASVSPTVMGG